MGNKGENHRWEPGTFDSARPARGKARKPPIISPIRTCTPQIRTYLATIIIIVDLGVVQVPCAGCLHDGSVATAPHLVGRRRPRPHTGGYGPKLRPRDDREHNEHGT